jgi:hypothetical protein
VYFLLVIVPNRERDLDGSHWNTGDWDEEGEFCPRIDANLREKEIGSWFSRALTIKTIAEFSLGKELGMGSRM